MENKIVRELIGKADEIIHARNHDREGQLLVDEVLDFVGNKKTIQRILLNGYSTQTVLDTMQMLYEKKLTTYPRSDCEYLSENHFADSKEILEHLKDLPNFSELGFVGKLK